MTTIVSKSMSYNKGILSKLAFHLIFSVPTGQVGRPSYKIPSDNLVFLY